MFDHLKGMECPQRETHCRWYKIELYETQDDTNNYFDTVSQCTHSMRKYCDIQIVNLYSQNAHNIELQIYSNCHMTGNSVTTVH